MKQYSRIVTSQWGEDGILEKIFTLIPSEPRVAVEFGAWDGKYLSNIYNLVINQGWTGVYIEGDEGKFNELKKNYEKISNVVSIHATVGTSGEQSLDAILTRAKIPADFSLLSVDVDGNDYHIWDSLKAFRPKVCIVEFNPSIPGDIDFIQPNDPKLSQGSSIKSIVELGKAKGYELVAATVANAIFVTKELFPLLGIGDNSIAQLWDGSEHFTRVFQLLDGTVKIAGNRTLFWHDLTLKESDFQILPARLRKHPHSYGRWDTFLMKLLKRYRSSKK